MTDKLNFMKVTGPHRCIRCSGFECATSDEMLQHLESKHIGWMSDTIPIPTPPQKPEPIKKFKLPPNMQRDFDRAKEMGAGLYEQSERSLLTHIREQIDIFYNLGERSGAFEARHGEKFNFDSEGAALFIVMQAIKVLEPQFRKGSDPLVVEAYAKGLCNLCKTGKGKVTLCGQNTNSPEYFHLFESVEYGRSWTKCDASGLRLSHPNYEEIKANIEDDAGATVLKWVLLMFEFKSEEELKPILAKKIEAFESTQKKKGECQYCKAGDAMAWVDNKGQKLAVHNSQADTFVVCKNMHPGEK